VTANKSSSIWKSNKARIIFLFTFFAGLAAFLVNATTITNFIKGIIRPQGVKLVSASFTDKDSLDIKLRNTGNEIAIIKRIELTIRNRWLIVPDDEAKTILIPSGEYDIKVDTTVVPGDVITKDISQQLAPSAADRILFRIGTPERKLLTYVYMVDLAIVYDEDNKTITQPAILFTLESKSALYNTNKDSGRINSNLSILNAIDQLKGIKSNELLDLIRLFQRK
jgi:hypothetical protein